MQGYRIPDELIEHANKVRGRLHLWDQFPGSKTALVVVDMQNYFVAPAFPAEVAAARDIVPSINRLARAVRANGGRVIWIMNTTSGTWESRSVRHEFHSPERAKIRMEAMELDADGFQLWPELDVRPEDTRLLKRRYSAFLQGSSDLPSDLRDNGIDFVLIAGTYTNVCCQTSAQDAMMLNFRTVMVSDCNAGSSPEAHAGALNNFFKFFGDVLTADEVIARLSQSGEAEAA
jgi:ureidoacrylate peracid hydrolase